MPDGVGQNVLVRLARSPANYWSGLSLDVIAAATLIVCGLQSAGDPLVAALALAAGLASYTFYEYGFHRWLYHGRSNAAHATHDVHHQRAATLHGAPFFYSLSVCCLTWLLSSALVGGSVGAVFAGSVLFGYWCQSVLHHLVHYHGIRGCSAYARLRRHHNLHHRDSTVNFGVVTRFWDRVFGTCSDR